MNLKTHYSSFLRGLIGCFLLLGLACSPALVLADLPPRPPHVFQPAPGTGVTVTTQEGLTGGGYIRLTVDPAQLKLWSVVQWQDSGGNWHDVEAWRGVIDQSQQIWWVAEKDFGTGPFRWVIYRDSHGEILAQSQQFFLPATHNQLIDVIISSGS